MIWVLAKTGENSINKVYIAFLERQVGVAAMLKGRGNHLCAAFHVLHARKEKKDSRQSFVEGIVLFDFHMDRRKEMYDKRRQET